MRACFFKIMRWWLWLGVVLGTPNAWSENKEQNQIALYNHGNLTKTLSLADLRQIVKVREIMVYEPHEGKEISYVGTLSNDLFDSVYGADWKKQEEILFTCVDGYQPSIPVSRFLNFKSYLVFERSDQKVFQIQNHGQNEANVALGPFYLVWDNLNSQEVREWGANGWPYQVAKIDLVNFAEKFPKISPPPKSNKSAQRGFVIFRDHCLSCHTINGDGGGKAPELNFPVNVTEYFDHSWLKAWILDPQKIRYSTTMPGFKHLKDSAQKTADVISYLQSMKDKKIKP